jgi:NAD(P)-dependent dehydrogenase (short-subunit alcohol dehydrogenase family)
LASFSLEQVNFIQDKVVIVTGANSGIGFEIAKTLSSKGAKVILACRNETQGLETQNQIKGNSEYINLDLGSFASIEQFSESLIAKHPRVDVLINNAGVYLPPFSKTKEKLELTFGVNYIGCYFLTNKIMPVLRDVSGSRVINMSSIAHYRVNEINWDNINSEIHYNKQEAYDLSNLFRIMFAVELEQKLRQRNYQTIAISCHPGVTITNICRHIPMTKVLQKNSILTKIINRLIFQSPLKAAMPALMATTSLNVNGGDFVGLDTKRQFRGRPVVVRPNELVFDQFLRETMWRKSVEISGVDLE